MSMIKVCGTLICFVLIMLSVAVFSLRNDPVFARTQFANLDWTENEIGYSASFQTTGTNELCVCAAYTCEAKGGLITHTEPLALVVPRLIGYDMHIPIDPKADLAVSGSWGRTVVGETKCIPTSNMDEVRLNLVPVYIGESAAAEGRPYQLVLTIVGSN